MKLKSVNHSPVNGEKRVVAPKFQLLLGASDCALELVLASWALGHLLGSQRGNR